MEATVESLRKMGIKVGVTHHRNFKIVDHSINHIQKRLNLCRFREAESALNELYTNPHNTSLEVSSRGGITVVTVTGKDGSTIVGTSECSIKDNFNRRLGVKIALNRALKQAKDLNINLF